jgi:hypothetical protein
MLSITLHGFSRGLSRFLLSELSLPILSLFFVPFWLIIVGGVAAFVFGICCSFVAFKYMIVLEKYVQSLKNKDLKEFEMVTKEEEISKGEFLVDSEMLNTGSEVTFAIPTETTTEHTTDNTHTETKTETKTETETETKSEIKNDTAMQPDSSVEM